MAWLSQCFQRDGEVCRGLILLTRVILHSHLDALVGYLSRCWPIRGITEITNLVSKEKGLISAQDVGVMPCISGQKPFQSHCHSTTHGCPADGCPQVGG